MEVFKLVGRLSLDGLDSVTKGVDKVGKSTEQSTKKTNKLWGGIKKVGVAVAGAFAVGALVNFGREMVNAAASAEALNSQFSQVFGDLEKSASESLDAIAQETGILPNRLKGSFTQMSAFAKTTGMDTSAALDLTKRATMAAADSAAFYDRSIEDVSASLQSFLKGNYENDAALGISATETTRNAKANELYGKSFNDLDEDMKQLTLLAMVEDGNKLSGALGQAARESDGLENVVGNLKQAWTDFQAELGKQILPIVIGLMKGLTTVIMGATKWVTNFFDAVKESQTLQDMADFIRNVADRLKNAFSSQGMSGIISELSSIIPQMIQKGGEFIQGLLQGIMDNLPAVANTVLTFVETWITNIATFYPMLLEIGLSILTALLEGITTNLPMLLEMITTLLMTLVEMIVANVPILLQAGITVLQGLINGIVTNLPLLLQAVITLITGLIQMIVENLPFIISVGQQILTTLIDGIISLLPMLVTMALQLIVTLIDALVELLPTIIDAGIDILLALVDGIIGMLPQLISAALTIIIKLAAALLEHLPTILSAGWVIMFSLIGAIIGKIPDLVKALPKIFTAITGAFSKVDWGAMGKDIITGLWNGIRNMGDWLSRKIKGFVGDVGGWLKGFFGIGSPSKMMRDEIGKYLPQGIAVGIEAEGDVAVDAITKVGQEITEQSIKAPMFEGTYGVAENLISQMPETIDRAGGVIEVPLYVNGREMARAIVEDVDTALGRRQQIVNRGRGVR